MAKNELLKVEEAAVERPVQNFGSDIFRSTSNFKDAWNMASALAKSQLIPQQFHGKPEDTLIAIEMSQRIGASPFQVLQNLYIVHGKPAWSSQFLIACLNSCGRFSPLHFKMTGEKGKDTYGCIAWATERNTGVTYYADSVDGTSGILLESPEVTIAMAKKEGWYSKNGSKWQSMPELMLRYRTATLFARLYAPEITMGMRTDDEIIDVTPVVTEARPSKFEAQPQTTVQKVLEEAKVDVQPQQPQVSDRDKVAAVIEERNIPVSIEEVEQFIADAGEMFIADMIIDNINAIAESILNQKQG